MLMNEAQSSSSAYTWVVAGLAAWKAVACCTMTLGTAASLKRAVRNSTGGMRRPPSSEGGLPTGCCAKSG